MLNDEHASSDVGQCGGFQFCRGEITDFLEDPKQTLLPFNRCWLIKIPADRLGRGNRSIKKTNDLGQGNFAGRFGQAISSALAFATPKVFGALERQQDLFEEFGRNALGRGDRFHGHENFGPLPGQVDQGQKRIFTTRSQFHVRAIFRSDPICLVMQEP